MKVIEAISKANDLVRNTFDQAHKVEWLSRLDHMVMQQVIQTHEGGESVTFTGYDENTSLETVLLVPQPYDDMYLKWMEAQIHYYNGEYGRYNNAMLAFTSTFENYKNHYRETHMPKTSGAGRFLF